MIRQRRRLAGLTQEKLAERADLHHTHVSAVERGLRSPTVAVLGRISAALGVPAWVLLKEADEQVQR